jgi:putative CocE/NonD family hydrolase
MAAKGSEQRHYITVIDDVFVEMRDGTPLATDIYLPTDDGRTIEGKLPTVLERTPYDKENPVRKKDMGEWFASRVYAVVLQDFRGRFKSEGEFYKYANMGEDGFDTTEWIAWQPWSDGRIGTIGTSFMAHFQLALACMSPPHLTTMVVNQGGIHQRFPKLLPAHGGLRAPSAHVGLQVRREQQGGYDRPLNPGRPRGRERPRLP